MATLAVSYSVFCCYNKVPESGNSKRTEVYWARSPEAERSKNVDPAPGEGLVLPPEWDMAPHNRLEDTVRPSLLAKPLVLSC